MRQFLFYQFLAIGALFLLSSCEHDDPVSPIKPLEQRTVLLLTSEGYIYDQSGKKIMELPNCIEAHEIISDGDDYFVSGEMSKGRVGYWKNGKWNTLHVDFIEDVEHWTDGIGKWDYYIFLFDYPNILRNSGIFPLEDCEDFNPASKCMSVSEGRCYVVGRDHPDDKNLYQNALLYSEHKGKYAKTILPKLQENINAAAFAVFAYDRTHTVIGGRHGEDPCLWVDGQLQILPRLYDTHDQTGEGMPVAYVGSVTYNNGHIYAVGSDIKEDRNEVAMLWVDGVPQHLCSDQEGLYWSWALEVIGYGDDWYALTIEMYDAPGDEYNLSIVLWLNGEVYRKFHSIDIVNFTVL